VPIWNTGELANAMSCLLNGRAVGARLSHDVRARCRLEAFQDGTPYPMLIPQCPGPGEPWRSRDAQNGSVMARGGPC